MNTKIIKLQELLRKNNISMIIIKDADEHNTEMVGSHYKERTYISEFTGSNGTLLVTQDNAYLWTDGRYYLQAEHELKSNIKLMKMGDKSTPTLFDFVVSNLSKNDKLCVNPKTFDALFVKELENLNINLVFDETIVNEIIVDRKEKNYTELMYLDIAYTGKTTKQKIKEIRKCMKEVNATVHITTKLDDIAYTYNMRASDIKSNMVFYSFSIITNKDAYLYINIDKATNYVKRNLQENNVKIKNIDEFYNDLLNIQNEKIMIDLSKINYLTYKNIFKNNILINKENPETLLKAIKNNVEIKNNKRAHELDGLAVFKFMYYIKNNSLNGHTEYTLAKELENFRLDNVLYLKESFNTISAFNENAAEMHYSAKENNAKEIAQNGFLLVDSGGQYLGGTTDITRTYQIGELTYNQKHHYTMVLRAMIKLSKVKFLEGCNGQNLDILAREVMWNEAMDYKSGTGHGIGYMLNVHEAPNGFRWNKVIERNDSKELMPGMITTCEPGIYLKDQYGIRIENELLTKKYDTNSDGTFFYFEPITYAPIDLDPVIKKEMTKDEINYLNQYHKLVYKKLSKYIISDDELEYLKYVTRKL